MQDNKKCDFLYILSIHIIKHEWWHAKKLNLFQRVMQETKSLKYVKRIFAQISTSFNYCLNIVLECTRNYFLFRIHYEKIKCRRNYRAHNKSVTNFVLLSISTDFVISSVYSNDRTKKKKKKNE